MAEGTTRDSLGEVPLNVSGHTGELIPVRQPKLKCMKCKYEMNVTTDLDGRDVACPVCETSMTMVEAQTPLGDLNNVLEAIKAPKEPAAEEQTLDQLMNVLNSKFGMEFKAANATFNYDKYELGVQVSPDIPDTAGLKADLADIFGVDPAKVVVKPRSIKIKDGLKMESVEVMEIKGDLLVFVGEDVYQIEDCTAQEMEEGFSEVEFAGQLDEAKVKVIRGQKAVFKTIHKRPKKKMSATMKAKIGKGIKKAFAKGKAAILKKREKSTKKRASLGL